jgi:hypothetical protein
MPRKSSNQYITHRIELGVWERKQLEKQAIPMQIESVARASGYVGVAAAMGLAAYGLYWFFDAGWGITKNIAGALDDWTSKDEDDHWAEAVLAHSIPGLGIVRGLRGIFGV